MAQPFSSPERGQAEPRPESPEPSRTWSLLGLGALLLGMWLLLSHAEDVAYPMVDYSIFYSWLEADKVESVAIDWPFVEGRLEAPEQVGDGQRKSFRTVLPQSDDALLPLLRQKKVGIRFASEKQPFIVKVGLGVLPWLVLIGAWVWMSRRAQKMMMAGGGPFGGILEKKSRRFEKATAVNITFEDVAGLASAKRDLQEVVQFLREPERFRRLGGKVPRGVLLVGPPGTGKTLLARAVAGESGVPFFSITASEFIEMFVGVGAARVRALFEEAKKTQPAIIFIDEIDAVGRSRGAGVGGGHDEREQTLNQLLSEMDGFNRNDLTIVLAATNRPDVLDPALLRPGRFDRRVVVDRPELGARRAILDVHVRNKPLAKDVDLDAVAKNTAGFSGADLANLVNEAALHATRQSGETIGAFDFAEAYDKVVLGDPREAKLGPDERKRTAVHESGHAIVAQFSPDAERPNRITILPRGMALGATQQTPTEDRHLLTTPQLESRLAVFMGGYAAEHLVFGHISTGAENDLKEATRLATKMVAHYGMSEALGPAYYDHDVEHPFLGRRIATDRGSSDATTHAIEQEARRVLARALERASALLAAHRCDLDRLVQGLLDKETLEANDLRTLLGSSVTPTSPPIPAAVSYEPAA